MSDTSETAVKETAMADEKPLLTLRDLQNAVRDLYFSSESDEPVKALSLTPEKFGASEITAKTVADYRSASLETVKTLTIEEFFAPMTAPQNWWTEEEKATAARFTALAQLLTEGLTDAKAYRIGDGPEIEVYILGKNAEGKILGVRTGLTET
jgi:hypothetical protein